MWEHDGFMWGFGGIFMILFWILVLLAVAALIRWLALPPGTGVRGRSDSPESDAGGALEILEERYARGEIDREEFLQKRADLRG
jgi:putative membrane protein